MPVLDQAALNSDPDGLEFLLDVLGTRGQVEQPGRRFPLELWTPKAPVSSVSQGCSDDRPAIPAAPGSDMLLPEMA